MIFFKTWTSSKCIQTNLLPHLTDTKIILNKYHYYFIVLFNTVLLRLHWCLQHFQYKTPNSHKTIMHSKETFHSIHWLSWKEDGPSDMITRCIVLYFATKTKTNKNMIWITLYDNPVANKCPSDDQTGQMVLGDLPACKII